MLLYIYLIICNIYIKLNVGEKVGLRNTNSKCLNTFDYYLVYLWWDCSVAVAHGC